MKKSMFFYNLTKVFLLVLVLFSFITSSIAATKTWNNSSGGSWVLATNWVEGVAPISGDDVIISDNVTITDVPLITIATLTIGNSYNVTLTASTSSTLTISSAFTSGGNLTLSGSLDLIIDGTVTDNVATIICNGTNTTVYYTKTASAQAVFPGYYVNLTFSGSTKIITDLTIHISKLFNPGTTIADVNGSTIVFNGTSTQVIPAFNSTTGYFNLELNNSNGAATANENTIGSVYMSGVLTLTEGILYTRLGGYMNCLVINNYDVDAITSPEFSDARCIIGPIQRAIPTSAGSSDVYLFPVADENSNYRPVNLLDLSVSTAGYVRAECTAGTNNKVAGPGYLSMIETRYWQVIRTNTMIFSDLSMSILETDGIDCQLIGKYIETSNSYIPQTNAGTFIDQKIEDLTLGPINLFEFGRTCGSGLWVGREDNDVTNENNWDDYELPAALNCEEAIDIRISGDADYMPIIDENIEAYVHNLIIEPLASITVNGTLHICNNLYILSDEYGTGGLTQSDAGSVIFENEEGIATVNAQISNAGSHEISSPFTDATIDNIYNFTPLNLINQPYNPDNPYTAPYFPNMYRLEEAHSHNVMYDQNAWHSLGYNESMSQMLGYTIYDTRPSFLININHLGSSLAHGDIIYTASHSELSTDYTHNNVKIDIFGKSDANGTDYGTGPGNGWHLVGNPYPSPVDWDTVVAGGGIGDSITHTITYFKSTNNAYGMYAYYHPAFGSTGSFPVTKFIPAMQAFYIKNTDPYFLDHTLTFKNAYRSVGYDENDNYSLAEPLYKKSNIKGDNKKVQTISISAYKVDKSQYKDEAVVMFTDKVKGKFDCRFDGYKRLNTDPDVPTIYILSEGRYLNNHAYNKLSDKLVVPIGMYINTAGEYSINFSDPEKTAAGTHVYLVDAVNKTSHDLSLKSSLSFKLGKGAVNNRFFIKFSNDASDVDALSSFENVEIFSSANNLEVNINNLINEEADLSIYNLNGQKLMDNTKLSNGMYNYKLNYAPGIYFVKLVTQHDVYTKKVYIQ